MNSNDSMKKLSKDIVKIVKTMRKMKGLKNRPPYTPELHLPTPFFSYLESRHIGTNFSPNTKKIQVCHFEKFDDENYNF